MLAATATKYKRRLCRSKTELTTDLWRIGMSRFND
jgi:hypothetical protein